MNIKNILFKTTIILIFAHGAANAEAEQEKPTLDLNLGARYQFTTWDGSNNSTNRNFSTEGNMIGADFTVRYQKFYGGVSLVGGSFTFNGNAPDRPSKPNPASASTKIDRSEFNLIAGYQIIPQFSIFVDLQNIRNDWKGENYGVEYSGLGFGVNGNHVLFHRWIIYGSIGVIPLKIDTIDGIRIGDGRGVSLEFGGSYIIKDNMALSLSVKSQSREFDYTTAPDQTHDVGGLLLRYSYTFR